MCERDCLDVDSIWLLPYNRIVASQALGCLFFFYEIMGSFCFICVNAALQSCFSFFSSGYDDDVVAR